MQPVIISNFSFKMLFSSVNIIICNFSCLQSFAHITMIIVMLAFLEDPILNWKLF